MGFGCLGSLIDSQTLADLLDDRIRRIEAKTKEWGDPYCGGYLEAIRDIRRFIADEEPGLMWNALSDDGESPNAA